jgi:hypothetical protein
MFPRWCRLSLLVLVLVVIPLQSQGFANINEAGTRLSPITVVPKSCSGAFRYAARVGNSDIVSISPVQIFAEDRRLSRTRYTSRAMAGLGADRSALMSSSTMC